MTSGKSKYGLPRDIPAAVKRDVRRACGYGCIICGSAIVEYEHLDPPFAEAKSHDSTAIVLPCPKCHSKVTRGFLSKETVKEAAATPAYQRTGYVSEYFDIGKSHPTLVFGGTTIQNTMIPIQVQGVPLFKIEEAEEPGGPFRLSGHFCNSRGELSLEIVEYEWRSFSSNWDVETAGGVITVRDNPGHVSLQLCAMPPIGFRVEKLDMLIGNFRIQGNERELTIGPPSGGGSTFVGGIMSNCHIGFALG